VNMETTAGPTVNGKKRQKSGRIGVDVGWVVE